MTGLNPLRETKSIKWFNQRKETAHANYINTLEEKKKIHELDQLFKKFNENGTDTLKMSEVYNMFSYAGINIPE